eukprot:8154052-Alexandrium_andersonii.AAC.1
MNTPTHPGSWLAFSRHAPERSLLQVDSLAHMAPRQLADHGEPGTRGTPANMRAACWTQQTWKQH